MNKKEQRRLMVLNRVDRGEMIGKQAAEVLDLALRHVRRILAAYGKESAAALAHGNRRRKPTQFGRLMEELGITSIPARPPQAKGRIERLWGTFQDRLVSKLRLAGSRTIEEANLALWDFLPRYNQRFAIPAAQPGSAYRQPGEGFNPEKVFCFKYYRTVSPDNVVRFGEHRLQIMLTNGKLSYAHARVEVHERMDGSLAVYYRGYCLAIKPAPLEAPVLRARNIGQVIPNVAYSDEVAASAIVKEPPQLKSAHHTKPSPNHPWRRPFKIHIDRE